MRSGKRSSIKRRRNPVTGDTEVQRTPGTKLQHLAANHRKQHATPVTGLTIHDIVILP
jgi:hypothetical protein